MKLLLGRFLPDGRRVVTGDELRAGSRPRKPQVKKKVGKSAADRSRS